MKVPILTFSHQNGTMVLATGHNSFAERAPWKIWQTFELFHFAPDISSQGNWWEAGTL